MASVHQTRAPDWSASAASGREASNLRVYAAVALGYLLLMPMQFYMNIGGSVIPPYRIFLIISSLFAIREIARGQVRLGWADTAIIIAVIWICLAMSITSTADEALTASIAHITDIGFSYFFARAAFRNLRDVRMFLLLLLPGIFSLGLILVIEAVTHQHIIQGAAAAITGSGVDYRSAPRLGLMRAQGPFPHPISAGIFLSSFLPLYWLAGFKGWVRFAGAFAAICSFATVSSATLLSLVAAIGLLVYNWLSSLIANLTWRLLFVVIALVTFTLELGTGSGVFGTFVRFASLNMASSYNRVLIWRYGTQNVEQNPWFGIGYADWDRPIWMVASIDHYWLLTAMRFGLPASVLIGLATLLGILLVVKKSMTSTGEDQRCERGLAIAMAVFALGLISVSVWASAQVWYFTMLGMVVSAGSAARLSSHPTTRAGSQAPAEGRRHAQQTGHSPLR
ncbi:O-antigen ligase family protein [Aurantiacibacter poecillastricola]|uniref:O-antigen ligase family protein n=1 Tax=Aurantiacibacter poecillastricola TaxID=3064385 RepID=UPI00273D8512|nr:O-antigen ligase family protein [Aurantiacibacter sp. 219JJ12-13]MDP5260709.1 hypothetical protein [Aurantiacibacter sp. 219JJ12-13]